MSPVCVRSSASVALARPKSATQTLPSRSSSRFDGLMSRWRMPWPWAWARASATWTPIRATPWANRRSVSVSGRCRLASGRSAGADPTARPGRAARRTRRAGVVAPPRPDVRSPSRPAANRPVASDVRDIGRRRSAPRASGDGRPARSPSPRASQPPQLVQHRVEALALDELHDVEVRALVLADAEDRHDVGVVQPRRRAGLALEPADLLGDRRALRPAGPSGPRGGRATPARPRRRRPCRRGPSREAVGTRPAGPADAPAAVPAPVATDPVLSPESPARSSIIRRPGNTARISSAKLGVSSAYSSGVACSPRPLAGEELLGQRLDRVAPLAGC